MIASPLAYGNIVYVPTLVKPLQAFRAGGRGDITKSHLVFQFQNGPDIPTPVTNGTYFYSINDRGIVLLPRFKHRTAGLRWPAPEARHVQRLSCTRRRENLRHE